MLSALCIEYLQGHESNLLNGQQCFLKFQNHAAIGVALLIPKFLAIYKTPELVPEHQIKKWHIFFFFFYDKKKAIHQTTLGISANEAVVLSLPTC